MWPLGLYHRVAMANGPSVACKGSQPSHMSVSSLLMQRKRQQSSKEGRERKSNRSATLGLSGQEKTQGAFRMHHRVAVTRVPQMYPIVIPTNLALSSDSLLFPKREGSPAKVNIPLAHSQKGLTRALLLSLSSES